MDNTKIAKSVVRSLKAKGLPWWADAEDLVSIGVLALLEHPTPDGALARTVAHHAIVNALRMEAVRQRDREDDAPVTDGDGEEGTSLIDSIDWPSEIEPDTEILWKLAAMLGPHVYELLVLRFQFGYTNAEIAEMKEMSPGYARNVFSLAVRTIREMLPNADQILRDHNKRHNID
jgi:RNA polymerase sigma factor (sigma-70 family)